MGTDSKALYWLKPGGKLMSQMPKGGSEAYNQGWRDGCESGMSIFGHTFQKHFYRFRKDQRFYGMKFNDERDLFNGKKITQTDEKDYGTAWASTYSWCRHYMVGIQHGGAGMTPHLPNDDDVYKLHGTHNIYELQSWGNNTTNGWFANW
jgi:hypothetical protein